MPDVSLLRQTRRTCYRTAVVLGESVLLDEGGEDGGSQDAGPAHGGDSDLLFSVIAVVGCRVHVGVVCAHLPRRRGAWCGGKGDGRLGVWPTAFCEDSFAAVDSRSRDHLSQLPLLLCSLSSPLLTRSYKSRAASHTSTDLWCSPGTAVDSGLISIFYSSHNSHF